MRRIGTLVVLGLALLAPGCARTGTAAPGSGDWRPSEVISVDGVRPGPAPDVLLIDVTLPAGPDGCVRDPRAEQFDEENGALYVHVLIDSRRDDCPGTATGVVTFTAPGPLRDRTVVLNEQAWTPAGGAYRRCAADIGCHPATDHCDPSWLLAAFDSLDVPRHAARTAEHCDQQWLIMKVDVNSSACGAGGRAGCSAPPSVTRFFLRWRDGWEVFARGNSAGCAGALSADPTLPRSLCEHLPAPG